MGRFVLFIICTYVITMPFYLFSSGLPQPADMIIAIGGFFFFFHKNFIKTIKLSIFKRVRQLIFLIFLINTLYWFYYYGIKGIENKIYFPTIYYVFNFLFMVMMVYVLSKKNKYIKIIVICIVVSLSIQVILALLGIQRQIVNSSRGVIFFNNPNQLGYYSLSMLTIITILLQKIQLKKLTIFIIIGLSAYLVLFSGSRAALVGILLLASINMYQLGFKLNFGYLILILTFIICIPFVINSDFIQKKIDLIESRNNRNSHSNISEAQTRGYDRIYLNPQYIFLGAGEGKNDRFISHHQLEIHSAFGTMLFSYGILGLLLLLSIINESIKKNRLLGAVILLPVLVYNITHNGLRNSLLWGILGAMSVVLLNKEKNDKKS